MKEYNTLQLMRCAYIFHPSHNNYFYGTKEQRAERDAVANILRKLYDGGNVVFPYTIINDFPTIEIDGHIIKCYENMIEHIDGNYIHADVINGRTFKTFDKSVFEKDWNIHSDTWIDSKKFKSLGAESFEDGLKYYRVWFNGRREEFIVSCGKLYTAGHVYMGTTAKQISHRLGIQSDKAYKELKKVIDYWLED